MNLKERNRCHSHFIFLTLAVLLTPTARVVYAQDGNHSLAIRLKGPNTGSPVGNDAKVLSTPVDCDTFLDYFANFTTNWVESNKLNDSQSKLFRNFEIAIRHEIDSVPLTLGINEECQIDAATSDEFNRVRTIYELVANSSQRSMHIAEQRYLVLGDEIYDRVRREKFTPKFKGYTVDAQEKWVVENLEKLGVADPMGRKFCSDFLVSELGQYGHNALFRNAIVRDHLHWTNDRCEAVIFGFDYENFESAKIAPIKRKAMAEFLKILNDEQREMLARKLGIQATALPQLADITPATDLKRIFSESLGELPINHGARNKLLASSKAALAALRQFVSDENIGTLESTQAVQTVLKNLTAFPPGEFGDLRELTAEFDTELTQLTAEGSQELRLVLTDLVHGFRQYQKDAAAPWKWPDVVELNIQTSFGALEDDQLKAVVPDALKRGFSNMASARYLVADPSDSLMQGMRATVHNQNLNLPASQHIEILNAQVDHPRVEEFDTLQDRLKETNHQSEIIMERLMPRQSAELSAIYAQHFFFQYGPYNFFQRPDVAVEFRITTEQLRRMDEVAKAISERIEREVHPLIIVALQKLFEQLSDEEKSSLETLLDCKWSDVAEAMLALRGERRVREMMIDPFGRYFRSRKLGLLNGRLD